MKRAPEIDEVASGIRIWQIYDGAVKADLFSTALTTAVGTCLVDPIPLAPAALEDFLKRRKVTAIFVTNINHARASAEFAKILSIPVYAHQELVGSTEFPQTIGVPDGEVFSQQLTAMAVSGGPEGEMALHHNNQGGTMVLGDALINFEPHGFAFLPAKYCLNAKEMRRSLRKLLDYSFDSMLFAHGTPILSGARSRLEQLLAKN